MKKLLLMLASCLLLLSTLKAQEIKFANYYLYPTISMEQVNNLAKYDLLILDPNNLFLNREVLVSIKELNPNIKFLGYLNPMEIFKREYIIKWGDKPIDNIISKYLHETNFWWLRDTQGKIFEFDSRQRMLNMSTKSKKLPVSYFDNKKMRYWEFITRLELDLIMSDTIWDGIFQDNLETVEWLVNYDNYQGVDISGNKRPDKKEDIAKFWEEGLRKRFEMIKAKHPDYLILANKAKIFLPELTDGKMIENFPDHWLGTWHKNIYNAKQMNRVIINVPEERFEMALASALWLEEENNQIYLSIGQQDTFKDYYRNYKKLGKIISKRIDSSYFAFTNQGKFIEGKGDPFATKVIMDNLHSIIFFTTEYEYVIEMENGIVRFNPWTNPKNPNLDNFKVIYH